MDYNLQGTILPGLTTLADLSKLDLRNNSLAGEISNVTLPIRLASASSAGHWNKLRRMTQSCLDEVLQAACASGQLRRDARGNSGHQHTIRSEVQP